MIRAFSVAPQLPDLLHTGRMRLILSVAVVNAMQAVLYKLRYDIVNFLKKSHVSLDEMTTWRI